MKTPSSQNHICRFFFLSILFFIFGGLQFAFADVDITGSWDVDLFTITGFSDHQTWQLTQTGSELAGSGVAGAGTFSALGSITLDVINCNNVYDNSSYEEEFGGVVAADSNSITGSWFDSDSRVGTWVASRVGAAASLTPQTKITTPPLITVNHESATFKLRKFGKVVLPASRSRKASTVRLTVQYEVAVKNSKRHSQLTQVSAKNTVTVRNLPPGNYTARYRVNGLKNGKKAFSTNQSPAGAFTIRK